MRTYIYIVVLLTASLAVVISWFALKLQSYDDKESIKTAPIFYESVGESVKVAIIGAGAGGSSASYFLRKLLGPSAQIDVYEKSEKVGGRMAVINFEGHSFESGGSLIHSGNKYVMSFVDEYELGLLSRTDQSSIAGIYDGKEFVFLESKYGILTKLKMIWRYGFFSLWNLDQSLSDVLERFMNIYRLQDEEKAFNTVPEMLKAMGGDTYFQLTQKTAEEVMRENHIGELFIKEFVAAVTRNNYGQDSKVNAFTGYVSMAGAQGGSLFSIKGGNYQVAERLLENSNSTIYFNHHIENIRKEMYDGKISYFLDERNKELSQYAYDVVIVACPLEVQNLTCNKCYNWPEPSVLPTYQQTIATFLRGNVKLNYFHVNDETSVSDIFTTENSTIPFSSIGRQIDTEGSLVNPSVYKMFSRNYMKNETMKEIFDTESKSWRKSSIHWFAYPHYAPPEHFSPFVLDDGVLYVDAIERAASAIEMSCVGGRNAALLAKRYLLERSRIRMIKV